MEPHQIQTKTFPVSRRGYDRDEVDAFLRAVAADYERVRQAADQALQRAAVTAASQPVSHAFENVGAQVAAILSTAAQAADDVRSEAERQVDEMLHTADNDAAEMKQAAAEQLNEAKRLKEASQREASEERAAARSDAVTLVGRAQEKAAELEEEARQDAARTERIARANIEAILAEGRRDYEHLRSVQQECIDRLASLESLARGAIDGLSLEARAKAPAVEAEALFQDLDDFDGLVVPAGEAPSNAPKRATGNPATKAVSRRSS